MHLETCLRPAGPAFDSRSSEGYGGLLGIVPPALRILFGTGHLGVIYGLLYIGVAASRMHPDGPNPTRLVACVWNAMNLVEVGLKGMTPPPKRCAIAWKGVG